MSKFWHKTLFWKNVERTLLIFTGPTIVGLHEFGASDGWVRLSAAISFAAAALAIWMTDHNNNGKIDLFE